MITTNVGIQAHVVDLLTELIYLDYGAADAYEAAIDGIENPQLLRALNAFKEDHLSHAAELSSILLGLGYSPPDRGDIKRLLSHRELFVAGLMDEAEILDAIRSNEANTVMAYERAVAHADLDDVARDVLQRALADERRHGQSVLTALKAMRSEAHAGY